METLSFFQPQCSQMICIALQHVYLIAKPLTLFYLNLMKQNTEIYNQLFVLIDLFLVLLVKHI